jgi:hypothetical protein
MNEQGDPTSNTFDAEFLSGPAHVLWDPLLTRQLRVLLHADRLLSLQSRDDHRPPEFQHYASLSLALKLFDLIITHTGFGRISSTARP